MQATACRPNLAHSLFFINKDLLKDSEAHLFTYYLGCFCATTAQLSTGDRDHMACKK